MIQIIFTIRIIIVLLFIFIISLLVGYFFVRNVIWSIVWCDKGGKYNSLMKLKKDISLGDRISMKYLEQYTYLHKKEFNFWMCIKKVYVILEFVFLIVYCLLCLYWQMSVYIEIFMIVIILQGVLVCLIFMFQTDTNRNTKYDRVRLNKRKNRR